MYKDVVTYRKRLLSTALDTTDTKNITSTLFQKNLKAFSDVFHFQLAKNGAHRVDAEPA
jgi:hypothetical protein